MHYGTIDLSGGWAIEIKYRTEVPNDAVKNINDLGAVGVVGGDVDVIAAAVLDVNFRRQLHQRSGAAKDRSLTRLLRRSRPYLWQSLENHQLLQLRSPDSHQMPRTGLHEGLAAMRRSQKKADELWTEK